MRKVALGGQTKKGQIMMSQHMKRSGNSRSKTRSIVKWLLISLASVLLFAIGLMVWFIMSLFSAPDLTNLPLYHPFKSAKAQEQYLNYYDTRAKQWPVASESKYVDTSYGNTFVRISGSPDAPVLVLLPSVGASSLIWLPNVKTLSEHYRVYAIDNIYDVGRSVYTRAIKSSDDLVAWLDEVITVLELGDHISLMGLSFGGWITSQYALNFPHRLHKIVMIAPVATVLPIPFEWAWRGIFSAMPGRSMMKKFMVDWAFQDLVRKQDDVSRKAVEDILNDAVMGLRCFKFKMPVTPTVLEDQEWQSIHVPALFLVGEHEVVYSAQEAIHRLNTVAPHITTEMIPNASHDLTIVQAEMVNTKVIEFLSP
ncbi:alpha/beta hydrolase fold protein [Candidatus Vecturithrix granuli]|uniref:Alpha/beta hydrolase fold protein n=1 Tax=Vecturithrix granuli TaxID=1499967 RepID=A0A081C0P4_VECG1|nr:alpha/beta hydrolase fold protein [Candidatus Vecturithrix granuli]